MKKKYVGVIAGLVISGAALTGAGIYMGEGENAVSTAVSSDASDSDAAKQSALPNTAKFDTVSAESSDTSSDFSYSNVADVAEASMPSVVAITNTSVQQVRSYFSGQTLQYQAESVGSGIIVGSNDTELLICTNNHVVEDADELTVSFIDEESVAAQVKGTDASNDLAVIAVKLDDIPADTMNAIKVASLDSSDNFRVGEQVVAIGNALGYGQSVTTGIVSAKNRTISIGNESQGYYRQETTNTSYENLIQTDAAINPGNSGGALLNMNGEVIGINSAKASESGVEGMGYAIPISKAMPILEELMNKKTRTKLSEDEMGYIGIRGQSVSGDATQMYGIPQGIYLTEISAGTPAAQAGLVEGDILTAFDGEKLTSMQDLQAQLQYYAAGETVDMTVYTKTDSGYEEKTVSVTLGDRSELSSN